MIKSFGNKLAENIWHGNRTKLDQRITRRALQKLVRIDTASELDDLSVPPGNHLEALTGDRDGQHSIRINRQWRVCFIWQDDGVYEVEIVDYH